VATGLHIVTRFRRPSKAQFRFVCPYLP